MPTTALFALPYPALADAPNVPASIQALADRLAVVLNSQSGYRNKVFNGDFRVNQRAYASAASLALNAYGFDRWKATTASTTLTFTAAPNGQLVTINSGGSIAQVIERANMPAGTYVLSWTGTATGRVYKSGAAAPAYAASPVTVTLDGLADVVVEFTAAGGTRTVGEIQLELGSSPTDFEQRPIGAETALCQRYFLRLGQTGTGFRRLGVGWDTSTTVAQIDVVFPVEMRADPTFAMPTAAANVAVYTSTGTFTSLSALALNSGSQGPRGVALLATTSAVLTVGAGTQMVCNNAAVSLDFSAEL